MADPVRFILDGREVEAAPGETIWQVAGRHGIAIPHPCHRPEPGDRADGNCRACREVQVNDVTGMAARGAGTHVVFDLADWMRKSTCVGCGECVRVCPTGALATHMLQFRSQHVRGTDNTRCRIARGLTVVEIIDAAHAGTIKGVDIPGENPAMSDPDLLHARAGLSRLDHLVVQDTFLTETAWHANVVLPALSFPEKDGSFTNIDRRVQLGRKALPAPGAAREDRWIIQEIARRMGLDWHDTHPRAVFAARITAAAGTAA